MSKAQHNFFQWILSHAKEKLSKYQFKVSYNLLIKNKFCRWSSSLPDKTVQNDKGWNSTCRACSRRFINHGSIHPCSCSYIAPCFCSWMANQETLKGFFQLYWTFSLLLFSLSDWLSGSVVYYHRITLRDTIS